MFEHKASEKACAPQLNDVALNRKVKALQSTIKKWAHQNDLWGDCGFKTWIEHYDSPPHAQNPCVLLFCFEGNLLTLFNGYGHDPDGLIDQFRALIENSDFEWDMIDHTTIGFWGKNLGLQRAYAEMLAWRWNSSLIAPEYSLIHESIFQFFSTNDGKALRQLSPRRFEEYLDSLFQARGYRTELGPGTGDRGVDIRLYSSEMSGSILTLVQAKRYALSRPIRLEAVQALTAAVDYDDDDGPARRGLQKRGLFVTTSRFLPSAKSFAERKATHIGLIGGEDLSRLSKLAAEETWKRRAALVQPDNVMRLVKLKRNDTLEGQVFHARTGYGMIDNDFALCVKSSAGAALLCPLPKIQEGHDGCHPSGRHIPDTSIHAISSLQSDRMFMAKVKQSQRDSTTYLWGEKKLYMRWDGKPVPFDYCD
jgi:hypothetical protein